MMLKIIIDVTANILIKIGVLKGTLLNFSQKVFTTISRAPSSIQLHTIQNCNLKCDYCYSVEHPSADSVDWLTVLKQAKELGVKHVDFLGGEPLLDSKLYNYLEYCLKNRMSATVHTNGLLIDNKWIERFKSLGKSFKLSVKFDESDSFDMMIEKGHYERVVSAIESCLSNDITVQVHSFIHAYNYEKIDKIIEFAQEKRLFFTIERYMLQHRNDVDNKYAITAKQWNTALEMYNAYCNSKSKDSIVKGTIKGNGCSCYIDLLSVKNSGLVVPCPFASDSQAVGDVKKESLKKVWEKYKKFSQKVWMKIPDDCQDCKFKYFCHGGCKTDSFNRLKSYNKQDPLCQKGQRVPMGIFLPPK